MVLTMANPGGKGELVLLNFKPSRTCKMGRGERFVEMRIEITNKQVEGCAARIPLLVLRYTRRDSNAGPSAPEADALSS